MRRPDLLTLLEQLDRVHERTRRVVVLIPPADIDWSPQAGWFTFGGLVRHLAAIERWMYAENAWGRPSRFAGHGPELAAGYDAVLSYYDRMHAESRALFAALDDAMLEHEAHHRGQLYLMLAMRGVATPPIFGLTSEEVRARSAAIP